MNMPKNRWLAFGSHFVISLLLFLALLLIIVFFWYPGALFAAAGGWQGIRIVVGVDLVLGPLLTLIVYDRAKPDKVLLRDLAIIALIQLSCLTAGVFIVYDERPVAVTYAYDRFYVFKHSDFIKTGANTGNLDLAIMKPKTFYINLAKLSREAGVNVNRKAIAMMFAMARTDLSTRTDLYEPLPDSTQEMEALFTDNKMPRYAEYGENCVTVGLISAFDRGIACFDIETQSLRKFVSGNNLGQEHKALLE